MKRLLNDAAFAAVQSLWCIFPAHMASTNNHEVNYDVTNVCGTLCMHPAVPEGINLHELAVDFDDSWGSTVYSPTFAAVQFWCWDAVDHTYVVLLVFRSGVVNLVGARSVVRMRFWFDEFLRRFNEAFMYAFLQAPTIRVTMVAGAATLPHAFCAAKYLRIHGEHTSYEPSVFPGLKKAYKDYPDQRVIVQAFNNSARYVVTGAKNRHTAVHAAQRFAREVAESRTAEVYAPRTQTTGRFNTRGVRARRRRRELAEIRGVRNTRVKLI